MCCLVLLLYSPTVRFDFLTFDDTGYITQNETVQKGLNWEGVRWAFSTTHMGNWHPLAWISHMADVSLFGLDAGGHHLTNVIFHTINTALAFLLAEKLIGSRAAATVVALLFGIHPLRIESVAWVSERKDVLSTCFWLLSILAYLKYVQTQGNRWHSLAVLCHGLGLLSKPMGVTLPVILLLLDAGPLRRMGSLWHDNPMTENQRSLKSLVIEKMPFILLSLVISVVAFLTQADVGAVIGADLLGPAFRIKNALVSYMIYLKMAVFPVALACYYPLSPLSFVLVFFSAIGLVALSTAAVAFRKRAPLVAFGWFWFLTTLLPVIGLIQVGGQAHADRYTYIPLFGIFLIIGELSRQALQQRPGIKWWLLTGGAGVLLILGFLTNRQIAVWQNSELLFTHTLSVTQDNAFAHNNLAAYLNGKGRPSEAIPHLEAALRIDPTLARAEFNLAFALAQMGDMENAQKHFERGAEREPGFIPAYIVLGNLYSGRDDLARAISIFERAARQSPTNPEVNYLAGTTHIRMKNAGAAIPFLSRVLDVNPTFRDTKIMLCTAFFMLGKKDDATRCFSEAGEDGLAALISIKRNADSRDEATDNAPTGPANPVGQQPPATSHNGTGR